MRLLLRRAKTGQFTAKQLRDAYAPMVTLRRVQQLFAAKPDIVWSLMPTVPKLTPHHRHQRLKWGREMAVKGESWWRRVVFSDESRFPLDGPDGLSAHWHDTRRPWRWHHNRQNQGGSVMIWTCFSAHDKSIGVH